MRISLRELRQLLMTREGLGDLVARRAEEEDYVDFKETVNHRDPAERAETRADCAALASACEGYLVIGISETGDGRNEAKELVGIPTAQALDLKKSIEDCLGSGVDPPISTGQRVVRLVDLEADRAVLVVELRGRRGLPRSVETRDGSVKFVNRQAGKKKWLTAAEARTITRDLDLWRPLKRGVAVLLALALVVGSVVYGVVVAPMQTTVANQREKLVGQERKLTEQAQRLAEQERKLASRRLGGRNVPGEILGRIRARTVEPVAVTAASQNPETVALAVDIWAALQQLGLGVRGRCPGQDLNMITGSGSGVVIQSVEDSADDPLRVLAAWLRGEGFEVTFVPKVGANTIYVWPRSTE